MTHSGKLALALFSLAVLLVGWQTFAQDRTAVFRESSATWTEYRISKLPDGGAELMACGSVQDDVSKQRLPGCTNPVDLRGTARTAALQLGDSAALRLVKLELGVGDGGTP
jgi:hypothetical protein